MADPAETHWQGVIGNRQVVPTAADRAAAEKQFVEQYGHAPADAADRRAFGALEIDIAQNKYNATIDAAVTAHPVVSAAVLKSLLYQESDMNPATKGGAYVGIAQLGAGEARDAGLRVDGTVDERLDPQKAIGAAAATLAAKDRSLHGAYERYGQPTGDERAKFVLAAYNGGQGTVEYAMKLAHETGLADAQKQGLTGPQAEAYAKTYASTFDHLIEPKDHPERSPLYKAADHYLSKYGANPHEKYNEISHYANDVVSRAEQNGATIAPPSPAPGHTTAGTPPVPAGPDRLVVPGEPHPGFHIAGEIRDGRLVEPPSELRNKNHFLALAIEHAKEGKIDNLKFVGDGKESKNAIAAQNEVVQRAILANLPEHMQADYAAKMHLDPGPRIVGETVEGRSVESAAVLAAKNAQLQMAIAHAHHGYIDQGEFKAAPGESAAEVKRQNDILHAAIEQSLPEAQRAAYRESLAHPGGRPSEVAAAPAARHLHPEVAAPTPAGGSLAAFEKEWEANATVNPRSHKTTHPALSATLDQKNHQIDFSFTDTKGNVHAAAMPIGESSAGRYDAAHILPGKYQLGNFDWAPGAGATHPHDRAFGWADIPVNTRDGADHVPVILKTGEFGQGTYERLHGGGRTVDSQDPQQKLVATNGCVRGENQDVETVSRLIAASGKPIPLTITRDAQSPATVQRSSDGGKTWSNVPQGEPVVGRLHPTNDPNTVELITRNGNPPQTMTYKTDELGLTKQQITEMAASDKNQQIAIGVDQFNQPVVNRKEDVDRVPVQQREPVGVGR